MFGFAVLAAFAFSVAAMSVRALEDRMIVLTLYSRPGCHLCDDMKALVERVVRTATPPPAVEVIDISSDAALESRYGLEIPVLLVNGKKAAKYRVTEEELLRMLKPGAG